MQSSHKISPNTVSYLEEVLADGERLRDISKIFSNSKQNIVLQESTYNSIVNLLNNNAIEEKVRENFASILPKWIVKSEALSNQVFDAIGKCYSNKKLPVLSKACQKILITVAEAENATSRSMELLGNSFKRSEIPYLLKDLARKKDLKLSIASAKLICKSLSNATTSTKLQSVLSDTLEKQILSGSIHLEDIAEDLEELLLGDPHAKYVINLIKAVQKQQMAIPSRLLIALSRVIVKNLGKKGYPCDDALKIIYVEGAKALLDGAVFSNLETALMGDTVRSDNNVYRLTVAIFVQASSKIKISSNAIAYFEKSLNKNYKRFVEECQEWIDISEIGEDEKVVSTERVCAHDMSEDAVLEDMDKKINSEQIESILELLGFQVTDHGLSLKPHSISNLVYLTYEKQISNDGRNNANVILTVLINRGITISDVALQDLNKGLVTILESSSKNYADEKLVYDALPVLAVAVKEWNLQPHPILLKHFERLLESKNYKLGIYGIESILKLQESLSISDTNFKVVEALLDGKLTLDGTRSAINLLSYNLRNLKKTFDVSGLETLKKFIGQEELREALLSALMVHASNKGVISNQILALIILKYEISKVIDLLYEVSKHYEVKDQQILDLLGKYLIDTNSDKAFGILQKNKAKLGMDLQSILLQEEFVRNANNTAPVVFLKKIKEQGSKLTRRFLLNLEEFLKGEISTEESNEALGIVNYARKNKQKLTDGLISILLDKAVDKLDLIERIFDERAYSTEKLFHYLSKIFTLKSMDHKDVRKVIGLLSRILKSEDFSVKEITEALIDKLISTIKDNGDRNLSLDIIFFFKGLASKAGVVPESFFDETRKFLFSKDNGIRNKMLDLYNEVSINHEVSLEDLKSLFAILNLEDVGEKVFKILENFNLSRVNSPQLAA